jgi:hypothetical protein
MESENWRFPTQRISLSGLSERSSFGGLDVGARFRMERLTAKAARDSRYCARSARTGRWPKYSIGATKSQNLLISQKEKSIHGGWLELADSATRLS